MGEDFSKLPSLQDSAAMSREDFDKAHGRWVDNPGSEWLASKLKPGVMPAQTSGFQSSVNMPTSWLMGIKGQNGEHKRLTSDHPEVQNLARQIREDGGLKQSPHVVFHHKDEPTVYEGNHRIRAQYLNGEETTPVQFGMLNGAEDYFHPHDVIKAHVDKQNHENKVKTLLDRYKNFGGDRTAAKVDNLEPIKREQAKDKEWLWQHPGRPTARIDKLVSLPVSWLKTLPGLRGENKKLTKDMPKVKALAELVKDRSWQRKNPITLGVQHDGKVYIDDGNHRVLGATISKVDTLLCRIKYYGGGEDKLDLQKILDKHADKFVSELVKIASPDILNHVMQLTNSGIDWGKVMEQAVVNKPLISGTVNQLKAKLPKVKPPAAEQEFANQSVSASLKKWADDQGMSGATDLDGGPGDQEFDESATRGADYAGANDPDKGDNPMFNKSHPNDDEKSQNDIKLAAIEPHLEFDHHNFPGAETQEVQSLYPGAAIPMSPKTQMEYVAPTSNDEVLNSLETPKPQALDHPVSNTSEPGANVQLLEPHLPTSEQYVKNEFPNGLHSEPRIEPRIQPNDFTKVKKMYDGKVGLEGLPFSLNQLRRLAPVAKLLIESKMSEHDLDMLDAGSFDDAGYAEAKHHIETNMGANCHDANCPHHLQLSPKAQLLDAATKLAKMILATDVAPGYYNVNPQPTNVKELQNETYRRLNTTRDKKKFNSREVMPKVDRDPSRQDTLPSLHPVGPGPSVDKYKNDHKFVNNPDQGYTEQNVGHMLDPLDSAGNVVPGAPLIYNDPANTRPRVVTKPPKATWKDHDLVSLNHAKRLAEKVLLASSNKPCTQCGMPSDACKCNDGTAMSAGYTQSGTQRVNKAPKVKSTLPPGMDPSKGQQHM